MGSKPITQRAKCKYNNMPINEEVTIDAAGTKPAKLPSSPMKMVNESLIAGAGAMGMGSIRPDLPEIDKSYLDVDAEFSDEEKRRMAHNRSNKEYNKIAKKKLNKK